MRSHLRWLTALALAFSLGCSGGASGPEPAFPEDYAATYTEVRDCRPNGGSHDFNNIRVLADPAALTPYLDRVDPFPEGAVVLKEEYEPDDTDCSGDVVQWSVMQRLPEGNEDQLNWRWQLVDASYTVLSEDTPRCFGCHAQCVLPDGYQGTCTVP